jgi:hypothetical protein
MKSVTCQSAPSWLSLPIVFQLLQRKNSVCYFTISWYILDRQYEKVCASNTCSVDSCARVLKCQQRWRPIRVKAVFVLICTLQCCLHRGVNGKHELRKRKIKRQVFVKYLKILLKSFSVKSFQ